MAEPESKNWLHRAMFEGHVSLETVAGALKPWRLPHERRTFFPSPDDGLMIRAETASGVRLRFSTSARSFALEFGALSGEPGGGRESFLFDATIDGEIAASAAAAPGSKIAEFAGLPEGEKIIELWLPQEIPISLLALRSPENVPCVAVDDNRPRWVTYGSSLTHCVRAHSPARTWPAIVAREHGLNLVSLGFGGQCHLDAQVGFVIAELPADLITLKLGINCIGGSLSPRTFPAAVLSLVRIIRERHPTTPIALISPIGYPPNEVEPNVVGYTIGAMRRDMADVTKRLVDSGDSNLSYFDGLEIFDLPLIARYTEDQCHPDGDGIEVMARNFDRTVMTQMLERLA